MGYGAAFRSPVAPFLPVTIHPPTLPHPSRIPLPCNKIHLTLLTNNTAIPPLLARMILSSDRRFIDPRELSVDDSKTVRAHDQLLQEVADRLRNELIWCNGSWWALRHPRTGPVWRPFTPAGLQNHLLATAQEVAANQWPEDGSMVMVSVKLARTYRYQAFERLLRPVLAGTELPASTLRPASPQDQQSGLVPPQSPPPPDQQQATLTVPPEYPGGTAEPADPGL